MTVSVSVFGLDDGLFDLLLLLMTMMAMLIRSQNKKHHGWLCREC